MSKQMIVVGYTPDEFGQAALEHGVAESALRGTGVVVVNATRGDALVDDRFAGASQLERVEGELATSGVEFEVRQTMGDDVGDQVLEVAHEVGAALIVIGLRRRSPVGKLIMGSVSQRILLGAECPVLAVKPAHEH